MKENPSNPSEMSNAGNGMVDEEKREWLEKFSGRKIPEDFSGAETVSKDEWVDKFTGSENSKREMGTEMSLRSLAEKSGDGKEDKEDDVSATSDGKKWVDDFAGRLPDGEAKTGKEMSLKALAEDSKKETFVSKENKSDTEKKKKESPEEILARLEAEVNASRTAYAAKSHEMSGNLASWKRFLRIEKTNANDLAKGTYEYAKYQESVKRLVDWKMEAVRAKYSSLTPYQQMQKSKEIEAELEGIYRYAKLDEKVNLYSAYADAKQAAKVKDREGRKLTFKEKAFDFGGKAVNWYRKLPAKYKVAASVSLLAIGLGAGAAGAASVASAVGIAKIAQRFAGGAAAGVGMVGTQEQARRLMERREAAKGWKKNRKGIETDLLRGTPEELFNRVSAVCDNEIASLNDNLAKELKRSGGRKVVGFAMGAIVGSGAMAHVAKAFGMGFDHQPSPDAAKSAAKLATSHHGFSEAGNVAMGASHGVAGSELFPSHPMDDLATGKPNEITDYHWKEGARDFGKGDVENVPKPGPGADEIYDQLVKNDVEKPWANPVGTDVASAAEVGSVHQGGMELSIGKGGSLEGTVKHHLMAQGMDKAAAGREAHRLASEYAKQHGLEKGAPSLVHEGAKIHLGPDGKIIGVDGDKHLGWIEKDASGRSHFSHATPEQRAAAAASVTRPEPAVPQEGRIPASAPDHHAETVVGPDSKMMLYESMPEGFRKGLGEIDDRFGLTQYVDADIEKCREITAQMDALAAESHQAVGQYKDLPDLRVRLADIDNRLNSFEPGTVDPLEEKLVNEKMALESTINILEDKNVAFNELRERHSHYFAKVAAGLRRVMFGEDTQISKGDPQQIVNEKAWDVLHDPEAIGRGEKIIGIYQSLVKLPGGQVFEPKAGENMSSWTRRIMVMLMDSKKMKHY